MYSCRFLLIFENQSGVDKHETKKILLAVAGLALMLNASAQNSKRYYVAKPGTLVELMTEAEANEITQLTLQGKLNAVDFRHLRDEFKKPATAGHFQCLHQHVCRQERDLSKPFLCISCQLHSGICLLQANGRQYICR